jgi:Subtilase family
MPHIRLPRLADEARIVQGRGNRLTRRNQERHGRQLLAQLEDARREFERQIAARPRGAPAVPQGVQLLIKGATSDSGKVLLEGSKLKGLLLEIVEERRDGLFVVVSTDPRITRFEQAIEDFRGDVRTARGIRKRGERQIFEIDRVEVNSRREKIGDELALIEIRDDRSYTVDIEFAAGSEHPSSAERRREFSEYIAASHGRVVGAGPIVEEDYALLRAYITGDSLNDLLNNHPWVTSIDLPPSLERQGFELRDITIDRVPDFIPSEPGAPVVTVLDGGIIPQHPLVRVALDGLHHQSFLPGNAEVVDGGIEGHGTATVSLIALSSLRRTLLEQNEYRPVRAVLARILDDNSRIPDGLIVKDVIPRAVHLMHDYHGATVVSHCVASCAPFNRNRMSVWGETLDRLAYDEGGEGFLIVAATGNIDGNVTPTVAQVEEWLNDPGHPQFLMNERCRLRNPAQAINVLTVGAYVPVAGAPFHARGHGHELIGDTNSPSPFTRTGFGYLNEIKPEVVEEGGNWYRDGTGRIIRTPQITDVAVADSQFATSGRLVRFSTGTSLAVPPVAHLAARVLEVLPMAGADLLRAMVVNSALWPAFLGSTMDTLRMFGYGVPSSERALAPGGPRCVLYTEEIIQIGRVHFFRIPFPTELFARSPEVVIRVSITLAYRAPVRKTNLKYRGTILEWKFGKRGETLEQLRERCSPGIVNQDQDDEEIEEQPVGDWNWAVGSRLRTRGTVQKDWFEAPAADFDDELLLAVIGRRGWLSKEKQDAGFDQRYALCVSLEAIGVAIPIHEAIETRIRVAVPAV